MSVFFSSIKWNQNILDFNEGFRTTHTTGSLPPSDYTPFVDPFAIDGVNYAVTSHTVTVQAELTLSFATSVAYLDGSGFTFDPQGVITGGTVQGFALQENSVFSYGLAGCSINATDVATAMQTAGTADDIAAFNAMLGGQDLALLSNLADTFNSGTGRDLVYGQNGADRIDLGADDDIVLAGTGNDKVVGGTGNDLIYGDFGNDALDGGGNRDILSGDRGNDMLTGGLGRDFFVFDTHGGIDTITDFVAADDQIILRRGAQSMADLVITKLGSDTVIGFADVTITLQNVARNTVTKADFIFGGNPVIDKAAADFFHNWDYFV